MLAGFEDRIWAEKSGVELPGPLAVDLRLSYGHPVQSA
jgi:hypothetical protein